MGGCCRKKAAPGFAMNDPRVGGFWLQVLSCFYRSSSASLVRVDCDRCAVWSFFQGLRADVNSDYTIRWVADLFVTTIGELEFQALIRPESLAAFWSRYPLVSPHLPWLRIILADMGSFLLFHYPSHTLACHLEAASSCAVSSHLLTAQNPNLKSYTFA